MPLQTVRACARHDLHRHARSPMRAGIVRLVPGVVALTAILAACGGDGAGAPSSATSGSGDPSSVASSSETPSRTSASPTSATPTATGIPSPSPTADPEFDAERARSTVETLAGEIGPREATSSAFNEAADLVERRFEDLGYTVSRPSFPVPAGDSWGVPVDAGRSVNVIADPPGFDPGEPHRVVGAHLDSVAVSPGAEDNASGVAVTMELARMAASQQPAVPTRFVAFGAEEPRGEGDDMHHFGSQFYVEQMGAEERGAMVGMVSLDRVGVPGDAVPLAFGDGGDPGLRDRIVQVADQAGIATVLEESSSSDHWSFEKADMPAAQLGSIPFAGYHSADDTPDVVDPTQLGRVGTIAWRWLQTPLP